METMVRWQSDENIRGSLKETGKTVGILLIEKVQESEMTSKMDKSSVTGAEIFFD